MDHIQTGRRAKEILESEIFKEAHAKLRESYIKSLLSCAPQDDVGRFRYVEGLRYLDMHKSNLETLLKGGEIAELEDLASKAPNVIQRIKRVF